MKQFIFGVLAGALLSSAITLANDDWDDFAFPAQPRVIVPATPFGAFPPALQSLPPLPTPHWQHVQPC